MNSLENISKELACIRWIAENLIAGAPVEDECSSEENDVYADLANLANSIGNAGIAAQIPDTWEQGELELEEPGDEEDVFFVRINVTGRYTPRIIAKSPGGAISKAIREYQKADFGELDEISGKCIRVEDENGNCLWESDSDTSVKGL